MRFDHGEPIGRIETLPILLFLFCLVAMFLALSGRTTHALLVDLPVPHPNPMVDETMPVLRIGVHADGTPTIDGARIARNRLGPYLARAHDGARTPGVIFEPNPSARYEDALYVLGAIRTSGLAGWQFCFGGLERHRTFDKSAFYKPLRLTIDFSPSSVMPIPDSPQECDPRILRPAIVL